MSSDLLEFFQGLAFPCLKGKKAKILAKVCLLVWDWLEELIGWEIDLHMVRSRSKSFKVYLNFGKLPINDWVICHGSDLYVWFAGSHQEIKLEESSAKDHLNYFKGLATTISYIQSLVNFYEKELKLYKYLPIPIVEEILVFPEHIKDEKLLTIIISWYREKEGRRFWLDPESLAIWIIEEEGRRKSLFIHGRRECPLTYKKFCEWAADPQ